MGTMTMGSHRHYGARQRFRKLSLCPAVKFAVDSSVPQSSVAYSVPTSSVLSTSVQSASPSSCTIPSVYRPPSSVSSLSALRLERLLLTPIRFILATRRTLEDEKKMSPKHSNGSGFSEQASAGNRSEHGESVRF